MPKLPPDILSLAGTHTPTAVISLVALMRSIHSQSIRREAARTLRAHMVVVEHHFPAEATAIAAEVEAVLGRPH